MIFESETHKYFYFNTMKQISSKDAYHKALIYLIGSTATTRAHFADIYNLLKDEIQLDCFHNEWQTSGTERICRLAFNLFNGTTNSTDYILFTPYYLFGYDLDDIFMQAIQIRFHL